MLIATVLMLSFLSLLSCSGNESSEIIRKKLDVILSDDLNAIIEDVSSEGLIEHPCFDLVFYEEYKEGNYSQKAVANFYFLKSINAKIVRKYRYYQKNRMWERYYNEYSFTSDTITSCRQNQ
jgi:hypothetical protein